MPFDLNACRDTYEIRCCYQIAVRVYSTIANVVRYGDILKPNID